jgi:DNA (cytosine-5)-methyltransferase 1
MNVLDLFSGIGGFSLGLERVGMKTVAFCEVDKKCQKVLQKHWPDVPIFDDVSNLTGEEIGKRIEETIDVIVGGFPCQDISVAGAGEGLEGKRSGLWSEFHRLIKEIKPQYAIIENVSALRSRGLDQVLRSLSEIGYDAEWNCIPASAFGAPHRRDRIWIMAYPRRSSGGEQFDRDQEGIGRRAFETSEWSPNTDQIAGSSEGTTTMAHADSIRSQGCGNAGISENMGETGSQSAGSGSAKHSGSMAHTDNKGSQGWLYRWADKKRESELGYLGRCSSVYGQPIQDQWSVEPDVGRVANGVPNRVDRLKQLGNAIVPQTAEFLGLAVLEREKTQCPHG